MVHEWALSVNNAAKKVNLGSGESQNAKMPSLTSSNQCRH